MPELPETIPTERLKLRPHGFVDVDDIMKYADDPEWSRFMPVPCPYERKDAEEWIAKQTVRDRETHFGWAVTRNGRVIGGVDLILTPPTEAGFLGYALAPTEWGRGYMTEAVKAVMEVAFQTLSHLHRIWAWADARNAASLRVMEKLGMTREGCLRQHKVIRGEFVDAVYCGILRSEWEASQPP